VKRPSQAATRTLLWLVVAATVLAVFVLPWFVPSSGPPVSSDSQAVGFTNRVAMIGLGLGTLALALLGFLARREPTRGPLVVAERADGSLAPWLVASVTALGVLIVLGWAFVYQGRTIADAGYFVDRMTYAMRGAVVYRDLEFSYGPLMLYPAVGLASLLRPLRVPLWAAYYVWAAIWQAAGLLLLAYLVNRIEVSRRLRTGIYLTIAAAGILAPTVGLNYMFTRFLAPYAIAVATLAFVTRDTRSTPARVVTPVAAAAFAFLLSPELGVACTAALLAALGYLAAREGRVYGLAVGVLVAAGAGAVVLLAAGARTFSSLAGGAYYFPVLPGPPALLFVTAMLLIGWGIGTRLGFADTRTVSVQVAWLAVALVLIAPALGRADFGHIFWNGLGAFILAPAVIAGQGERATRAAWAFAALVCALFLGMTIVYFGMFYSTPILGAAAGNGVLTEPAYIAAYSLFGGSPEEGSAAWRRASRTMTLPRTEDVVAIADQGTVVAPAYLEGVLAEALVSSKGLVSSYGFPAAFDPGALARVFRRISAAHTVLMPYSLWARSVSSPSSDRPDGLTVRRMALLPEDRLLPYLTGWPLIPKPRAAVLDPEASLGLILRRKWRIERRLGDYVVLERR
jgi:hypothetical protein